MIGILSPRANPLAKETPVNKAPDKPGPLVTDIKLISVGPDRNQTIIRNR